MAGEEQRSNRCIPVLVDYSYCVCYCTYNRYHPTGTHGNLEWDCYHHRLRHRHCVLMQAAEPWNGHFVTWYVLVVVTIISAIAGIMYIQLVSLCAIFEADVCLGMSVPPLVFLVAEATFAIAAAVLTGLHLGTQNRAAAGVVT
eukprot:UN02465